MKRAFQYIRISTKDQSNFSISGQREINERYASKHEVIIVDEFLDDGASAKNFDRPSWIELEKQLYKHRHSIDFLIVAKYDRLVRHVSKGLAKLETIEDDWNIKVISASENFFIEPTSPFFFKMRADMFVAAEFERRVISDRTSFGTWTAKTKGRYIGKAPIGYKNQRDSENKPIIVVDENKAPLIRKAFELFVSGYSFHQIRKFTGITTKGNSAIQKILSNATYAGLIPINAYKDEKARIVKGLHEPIIREEVFWQAMAMMTNADDKPKMVLREELPLRGLLRCDQCNKILTGGKSKGRSKYYWYYRCMECSEMNISAPKVHGWIYEILGSLSESIDSKALAFFQQAVNYVSTTRHETRNKKSIDIERQITSIDNDIEKLEERFITTRDLDRAMFEKWRVKYEQKKIELASQIERRSDLKLFENWSSLEEKIKSLSDIYDRSSIAFKQSIVGSVLIGGSNASQEGIRTARINVLFDPSRLNVSCLRGGNKNRNYR